MDAQSVAQTLDEMGTLLEIRGENPFRCRAYHSAATALRGISQNLADVVAAGSLESIPGIGGAIAQKITQLATTGSLPEFDELRRSIPEGLPALLRIPGLGPRKIQELYRSRGIASLDQLKKAAEAGELTDLKGYGAKTIRKILEGIAFVESTGERILQSQARRLAGPLVAFLRSQAGVARAEIAGSLRRCADTIGDLDLVFASDDPPSVLSAFAQLSEVDSILASGPTKVSVRLKAGVQCDVRGVSAAQFPFALNYFTGSKEHNIQMRRRAQQRGLKLSEYALENADTSVACGDETALYQALGLDYIEPELRQGTAEIEAAETHRLPQLVELADLRGTFHCHSDWSDGGNTLEEMVRAAIDAGLTYVGFADHSRSAAYARGLTIERVREQWQAIDALRAQFGSQIQIFKGIESDILADGSLDYPDEILAGFDYVVGSVHSGFHMTRDEMTQRIQAALANPYLTMLGHPTGRLLLARAGYPLDLDAVLQSAARHGKLIEINANPHRLDLDFEHCRKAHALGIELVVNPDAHSTAHFAYLGYGISVARRGWLPAGAIYNARSGREVAADLTRRATARPS